MYSFASDYLEGAHSAVLERLSKESCIQHPGYGEDSLSLSTEELIKNLIGNPKARVYFLEGGTQCNMAVICSLLRPSEGVICATTGHIWAHETGAIEATGHRVITTSHNEGKLRPSDVEAALSEYTMRPHVLKPGMVYIANSTEVGTVYSLKELEDLHECCKKNGLLFYMDGARLGTALAASDVAWTDLARLTDVFYIGGTKNGALLGEAVVFNDPSLAPDFDYIRKQRGALLAKTWVIAAQFDVLLKDGLYLELAAKANRQSQKIASALQKAGFEFLALSPTNQVFPVVTRREEEILQKDFVFEEWADMGENLVAIRFVCSWWTAEEEVDNLIEKVTALRK